MCARRHQTLSMEHGFWNSRWQQGRTGFHEAGGNAKLRQHWGEFLKWWRGSAAEHVLRVLVPLCGKSPDLGWLAEQGHEVVGVEFVEMAARAYFDERGLEAERATGERFVRYRHGRVSIVVGDFFEQQPADLGRIDVVIDRAALVAVEPRRRTAYVRQLARLSGPGAGLFLVTFEHDIGSGPPFSVEAADELLAPHYESERHAAQDILELEPRFRQRGASTMLEVVWFARRQAERA